MTIRIGVLGHLAFGVIISSLTEEMTVATAKKNAPAKKAAAKHTPRGLKQDRARVATKQPYEMAYEVKKTKATPSAVKKAAKAAGPSRKAIEKKLGK